MLEGAKRRASMCQDFYLTFSVRERYIVFVWNQDEVSQNSRYAKRFYYSR